MLRKVSIIGMFFVFVVSTFMGAACVNTGTEPPKEQITLTIWRLFDGNDVFDPIISAYVGNHPEIKINYVKMDYDEYELKTSEALAAGTGPDIWMIRNDWMPRHYDKLVPLTDGALAKPNEGKSDTDVYSEKFAPVASEDNIINGKIYGIPLSIDTLALYYNTSIFQKKNTDLYNEKRSDEAKLFEKPPANWDDFVTMVKLLSERNGNDLNKSAVAMGTANNLDKHDDILYALMLQNSTQMVSADKLTATFNLSVPKSSGAPVYPGTNALDYFTSFSNPKKEVYTWNNSMNPSVSAFMNGETAMMFHYSYIQKTFIQEKPTLNYAIGPLPQIKGTTKPVDFTSYWVETVTKNSKHPKEAWDFILNCAFQSNGTYTLATKRPNPYSVDNSSIPSNTEQRATWQQESFNYQKMSAKTWYKGVRPDKVDNIMSNMINSTIGGQPSQAAIDSAAAAVTELLKNVPPPLNTGIAPSTETKPVDANSPQPQGTQ